MGLAFGVKLEEERIAAFIEALQDLSELQIKHAFKRAVKSWQPAYGRTFPSPAELREYAEEISGDPQPLANSAAYIDPEKLPKGWSEQEWKRAKLTLQVSRANADRPTDDDGPRNETRKQYAERIIAAMRSALKSGANSFPGAKT